MSYSATVYNVLIAAPSDVSGQKKIIREVLGRWNKLYSEERKIVLMPVSWEDYISGSGKREFDLFIGTFWTRKLTDAGDNKIDEEINKLVEDGNVVITYFSNQPVIPESVDKEKYDKLIQFRQDCIEQGVFEAYDSLTDFREKLMEQLEQLITGQSYFNHKGSNSERENMTAHELQEKIAGRKIAITSQLLTNEAKDMLQCACQDPAGIIVKIRTRLGLSIRTNNREFINTKSKHVEQMWENVIAELLENHLIIARGVKGEVYGVSNDGYKIAALLRSLKNN